MPRPFPPEFRFRAVALVRARKPITTAAIELGIGAAALHKGVRQDQVDRGERPGLATQNRRSCRRRTSASGNSKPKSTSSVPPRRCSGRTGRPQKDSPAERLPRRRRAPAKSLLPTSRRQQPGLLHVQVPADVTDADAPSVPHWFDSRSPHSLATDLRVSTCARGAHARHEHHGEREPRRRTHEDRRDRRLVWSGEGQSAEGRRYGRRSRAPEVPSSLAKLAVAQ